MLYRTFKPIAIFYMYKCGHTPTLSYLSLFAVGMFGDYVHPNIHYACTHMIGSTRTVLLYHSSCI